MKELLKLDENRRNKIFETTANQMNVSPIIIEKDFWVCVVLDYLMNKCKYKECFLFKGGTSLSKCYNVIDRFSEDLDIVIKWDYLGFTDEEVYQERSKTQNALFEEKMNITGAAFIQNELKEDLKENLLKIDSGLKVVSDDANRLVLYIKYNQSNYNTYINSAVKLELGPIAVKTPTERRKMVPYYNAYFNVLGLKQEIIASLAIQ